MPKAILICYMLAQFCSTGYLFCCEFALAVHSFRMWIVFLFSFVHCAEHFTREFSAEHRTQKKTHANRHWNAI